MVRKVGSVILFMSSYPPRECGIATFTKDITESFNTKFSPAVRSEIVALNKNGSEIYNYPNNVKYQINDNDIEDFILLAKKVNNNEKIKGVCIQHEFGLFGGEYGDNLLTFLELLEKPIIINFHSVLPNPDEKLKKVVNAISEKVRVITVMNKIAINILRNEYDVKCIIEVIPHGIPDVLFENQDKMKKNLGYNNRKIISSFGFMSRGKGYEYVIDSLPELVKKYPDLLYLIIGETHPVIRKNDGEEYRKFLEKKVVDFGLQNNVKFYNKYLTLQDIIMYLKASDIYISSGLNPNQITSGTVAYAMGCGRIVVSTPFLHAKDCLDDSVGRLVEFKNSESFGKAINDIFENEENKKKMEINSYNKTRHMIWENVALSYGRLFSKILKMPDNRKIPPVNLKHLYRLTDHFGIIQFANQHNPDKKSGYTLDDNARALLVSNLHYSSFREFNTLKKMKIYLDFLNYVQDNNGKMLNCVNENRKIDHSFWSEDAQGRGIWACGFMLNNEYVPNDFKKIAKNIINKSIPIILQMQSPRAIAFSLIGLCYAQESSLDNLEVIKKLSDWLVSAYNANKKGEWHWFEPYLTYSNSKLSEALFHSYLLTGNEKYKRVAEESINFLIKHTFNDNTFEPIGQDGWFLKDKEKSYFDQQPVEAAYMLQTLLIANKVTPKDYYVDKSKDAFQWFLGRNSLKQVVYNEVSGGCYDGIGKNAININQGAESILSYLMARLSLIEDT
jgi:glycosyltransferase involved in cell wall biosynthesis